MGPEKTVLIDAGDIEGNREPGRGLPPDCTAPGIATPGGELQGSSGGDGGSGGLHLDTCNLGPGRVRPSEGKNEEGGKGGPKADCRMQNAE
jgi:hypothetical protein